MCVWTGTGRGTGRGREPGFAPSGVPCGVLCGVPCGVLCGVPCAWCSLCAVCCLGGPWRNQPHQSGPTFHNDWQWDSTLSMADGLPWAVHAKLPLFTPGFKAACRDLHSSHFSAKEGTFKCRRWNIGVIYSNSNSNIVFSNNPVTCLVIWLTFLDEKYFFKWRKRLTQRRECCFVWFDWHCGIGCSLAWIVLNLYSHRSLWHSRRQARPQH
jgi:hypothetical protein